MPDLEAPIYLLAAAAIIAISLLRKRGLSGLSHESLPEMDKATFLELRGLLETSYDRGLYLGLALLLLGLVTLYGRAPDFKVILVISVVILFLYNVPPRNQAMKIMTSHGVDRQDMKRKGVRL
jgi:hypothetical protein